MPSKSFSLEEKSRALTWVQNGISTISIAQKMGCSDRSVQKLISASKSLPINTIPRRKVDFGRKNTLSLVDLRGLKRCVLEHPTLPAARINLDLPMVVGHLSDCRVQEILNKVLKLSSRASAKKPLLAKAMKKKRLSFCKQYKDWIEEEWSRVMFSEESMCRINRAASTRVRRLTRSNRFDSGFTVKTVNHSPGLMIWGSFTGGVGRGSLYVVPKGATMNGEGYKEHVKAPSCISQGQMENPSNLRKKRNNKCCLLALAI
jgi:hypothetical protein